MITKEDKSLRTKRPDIFSQVNHELTALHCPQINLEIITYGSKKKIWWNCVIDNRHVWDASPNERTAGAGKGCLVCAGYRIMPGVNDLVTLNPTVASQWHPHKNGELLPSVVSATGNKKVWWQCSVDNRHEWMTQIKTRHYGSGCSVCDNKVIMEGINDFATYHPELVSEWNHDRNGEYTPYNVAPSSAKKIWWNCPKDERHIYLMSLNDRHNNHGCTVCPGRFVIQGVNDAATHHPHLVSSWHPTKNGDLDLTKVSFMSEKKIWWICETNPLHEWENALSSRASQGSGCPVCSGNIVVPGLNDFQTNNPLLAEEWHPTLNGQIIPNSVAPSTNTKYWWQCVTDDTHAWQAAVNNRNKKNGTGCPQCIIYKTEAEFRELFNDMTDLVFLDGRVPVKWNKRPFTQIDILNIENKIAIEYDGLWSHGGKKNSPFSEKESLDRDMRKTQALLDAGYLVMRIREEGLKDLRLDSKRLFQIKYNTRNQKSKIVQKCCFFIRKDKNEV